MGGKKNPSRPKLKAVGAVDGQGTVCSLVSDGAVASCPSSTRNRPCCDERNTHLLWPRDGLLHFRWGPFGPPPSLARFASLATRDFFFGPEWISQGEAIGATKRPRGGGELGGDERGGERVAPGVRALAFACPSPQCQANGEGAQERRSVKTRQPVTVKVLPNLPTFGKDASARKVPGLACLKPRSQCSRQCSLK